MCDQSNIRRKVGLELETKRFRRIKERGSEGLDYSNMKKVQWSAFVNYATQILEIQYGN